MELQPNTNEKMPLKPTKGSPSSPTKCTPSTSSTPTTSTSKVLIITPEQIAKLGLTQQINKVVQSQVNAKLPTAPRPETEESPRKRNVRISKITIISPKSNEDEELKNKETRATNVSVASAMKNKLSNLLKTREKLSTFQLGDINSKKGDHQDAQSEISERKRKQVSLKPSSSKIIKISDDDLVLVDAQTNVPEEHPLKMINEESVALLENVKHSQQNVSVIVQNENREVVQSLNAEQAGEANFTPVTTPAKPTEIKIRRAKIKSVPNISNTKRDCVELNSKKSLPAKEIKITVAEQQQPKVEPPEISNASQSREEVKQKIHVLSNEQISLPHTFVASLKSHLTDRSSSTQSTPFFIYKSSNPNTSNIIDGNPVIDLVDKESKIHLKKDVPEISNSTRTSEMSPIKQEKDCVEDVLVKSEPLKAENLVASDDEESTVKLENLDKHFIDKDTVVVINDSHIAHVFSDDENDLTVNSKNSTSTNANNKKNLIKSITNVKPNLPVIDLTESVGEEELQKKSFEGKDTEIIPECSQNFPLMKSAMIKDFAAKIKNKIENTKELKIGNTKKTYSRNNKLPANPVVAERSKQNSSEKLKNLDKTPEPKTTKFYSFKMEGKPGKPPVRKFYGRKSDLSAKLEHSKENSETEISKTQNNDSEPKSEIPHSLKIKVAVANETSPSTSNETNNTEEHNSCITEHQIKDQEIIEIIKPAPKKRGRKKKSEMAKTETVAVQNNLPEPEVETSRRGRKRKVVDYFALSEGKEFDEPEPTNAAKKRRRTTTSSLSDGMDEKDGIVEIDTIICCNPSDNSINCSYSAQEITPLPKETPKRKRGRPPRIKVIDNMDQTNSIAQATTTITKISQTSGEKLIEKNCIEKQNIVETGKAIFQAGREKTNQIDSTDVEKTIENSLVNTIKTTQKTPVDTEKTNKHTPTDAEKVVVGKTSTANEITLTDAEKTSETSSNDTEKTSEVNLTEIKKATTASKQTNEVSSSDRGNTNTSANESGEVVLEGMEEEKLGTSKRKRGRPSGNEPHFIANVINTMFKHINTSTLELDKNEALDETNVKNTETTRNSSAIETISVKQELKDASFEADPDVNLSTMKTKKKRGRKKWKSQSNSVKESSSDPGVVICAVCNQQLIKTSWTNHKLRLHNNLAWKVGDPPLDLNNQKFVMSVLSDIYKRRKPLYCEKCGESKKSVLGYLSHKSMCQKSTEEVTAMRVKCEFCDRSVLPVSMSAHLKLCKAHESANETNWEANNSQATLEDSPVEGKRRAAKKAHSLIKALKEDGTIETTERKSKTKHQWYHNFNFRPTYLGKKRFRTEIIRNGIAKCRFEECQFETSDVDEICNHLFICEKKPTEGYTCKFCITTFQTDIDVLQHLKAEHSGLLKPDEMASYEELSEEDDIDEFLDDCDDDDKFVNTNKPCVTNKINLMHGIKFLLKHRYCTPSTQVVYPPALDWTFKFCKQNFSIGNLFPNWRTTLADWEKIQPTLIANYLPHLKYSACTAVIENKKYVDPLKLKHEWKRYKLFEADSVNDGVLMIFCGGPVFAMAWVPTPYDQRNCNQILAVSANRDIDKGYTLDLKYSESGLIQFWNCGSLSNLKFPTKPPTLEFCIAHDYGPIWYLEWCPSGCYDVPQKPEVDSLQRLGVLAVGSANSNIYLYSVCSPGQMSGKILKPKPLLKLVLDSIVEHTANDLEAHVTKISWSKASGHQYLLAGYANGMVAIYYLNTTSTLLQLGNDQDGIQMIMPYRVFTAHHHAVTVLSLYHLNDGRRWILTGSIDRTVKYWDLENLLVPLTSITKFIATDGVWLTHWLSSVHCFDDSCAGGLTYTAAHQLRNFESDSASVMHSNSRVVSITASEWINGFVQGNVAGEVKGFFPHQMFYSMDGDKSYRKKKVILGYTRLIEKGLSIDERVEEENQKLEILKPKQTEKSMKMVKKISKPEPITYKEAEQKYGLVFCDMTSHSVKDFTDNISSYYSSNKSDKLFASRPNIYPMQSITKVAFNPNQESFLYLATGYQAGFVRISYMRFLNRRQN